MGHTVETLNLARLGNHILIINLYCPQQMLESQATQVVGRKKRQSSSYGGSLRAFNAGNTPSIAETCPWLRESNGDLRVYTCNQDNR